MANFYAEYPFEGGGSGGGGVTSLNGLTGVLNLVAGTGISITPSGANITIANTGSGGTVTSVALALPGSLFTVSGSPVTTTGTLTGTLISQTANTFFAAPNGTNGIPSFRAIANGDLTNITTLPNLSLPYSQVTGGPGGTVTSVALTTPGVLYSVSGSPITTSGTLALNLIAQNANTVLAGPVSGGAANPSFRALVSADIPNNAANTTGTSSNITATTNSTLISLPSLILPTSQLSGTVSLTTQVSGILPIANGGTNLSTTPTNGQILIGNGTGYTLSAITSGSGITVSNAPGSITISNSAPFYSVVTINSNTNALASTAYLANTSGGSFTLTLPAPVSAEFIIIKDSTGSFQTNPLTVAPHAGEMIEGLSASKLLQTNWGSWSFFSDGTNWFMGPF
jgi:hypothetical protein